MEKSTPIAVELLCVSTLIKKITHQFNIPTANSSGNSCLTCRDTNGEKARGLISTNPHRRNSYLSQITCPTTPVYNQN